MEKKKILPVIITSIMLVLIIILITGCACPLFSLFERFSGLKISTGKNIDTGFVASDKLIYPGSIALVQVTGDVEKVLELIAEYGVALSEEEMNVLRQLPDEIKQQNISITAYSTADRADKVSGYYESLKQMGWKISDFDSAGSGLEASKLMVTEKDDKQQAFMIAGTETNSFIVFVDFDWSYLAERYELS